MDSSELTEMEQYFKQVADIKIKEDLKKAYDLYNKDQELEALQVLERMLPIPMNVDEALTTLRDSIDNGFLGLSASSRNFDMAKGVMKEVKPSVDHKLGKRYGGEYVKDILELKIKCYAALLDKSDGEPIEEIAIANGEAVLELYPNDPEFMGLIAPIFALLGDEPRAIKLLEDSLKIDPGNLKNISRLKMIKRGREAENIHSLTARAVKNIEDLLKEGKEPQSKELLDIMSTLAESLNIFIGQPDAIAGMSWCLFKLGRNNEAIIFIKRAASYDPSNQFVRKIMELINKESGSKTQK